MKKMIFKLLLCSTAFPVSAEVDKSLFLADIPSRCDAQMIAREIPMLIQGLEVGEVLDVTNVRQISSSADRLVCSAYMQTDNANLSPQRQITFSKNSMNEVLISY